jgi:predicted metalloprotease
VLLIGAVVAAVLVFRSGGDDGEGVAAGADDTSTTVRSRRSKRADRTVTQRSDHEVALAALQEVETYWKAAYPAVTSGAPYQPISGGFHVYGPRTELPPCPGIGSYDEIAENAFYCPEADLVAWDETALIGPLRQQFGELTVGIVFAHELGHAVQTRLGITGQATVTLEQQADCFAGGWVKSVADGSMPTSFKAGPGELDAALAGMLLLRDQPGTIRNDPSAHGSAFDRIGAFKDGFDNGAGACMPYNDELVSKRLVVLPWTDRGDFARGGNLPYADVVRASIKDLEDYWATVFAKTRKSWDAIDDVIPYDPDDDVPACGGRTGDIDSYVGAAFYCVEDDFVAWDDVNLMRPLYEQAGDFAVATIISNQYSTAVQHRLGETGQPVGLSLQADCLTGTWAASTFLQDRQNSELTLSPGDLDESVLALLNLGAPPKEVERSRTERGSAFERVSAFRDGFLQGIQACTKFTQS